MPSPVRAEIGKISMLLVESTRVGMHAIEIEVDHAGG